MSCATPHESEGGMGCLGSYKEDPKRASSCPLCARAETCRRVTALKLVKEMRKILQEALA